MHPSFIVRRKQLRKGKRYEFAGAVMSYSVIGSGKPVILLHGSMTSDPWNGFEKRLAKFYTVYLPHLPGFGASDAVRGKLHTTDLFADSFSAFITHGELATVPVIACSLGSVVAVKSAVHKHFKGTLILVGMPAVLESKKLKAASFLPVWIRRAVGSTVWGRKNVLIPVLRSITGAEGKKSDQKLFDELRSTDTRSLVDTDVHKEIELPMPALLPRVQNKIVFLYGSHDTLAPRAQDCIRNPFFIKNAGHNIFTSQPEESLRVLRKILR